MKTANLVMVVAAAGMLSGCLMGDPNTFTATPEEMAKAMIGKTSSYQRKQYKHTMRVTSGSAKGVYVSLSADGGAATSCRINFEAVDASTTRIVPDCGTSGSAMAQNMIDFTEVKVLEQAKHILTGEPVDVAYIESAMMTHSMKNLPAMQKEAQQMSREVSQLQKDMARSANDAEAAAGGWGSQ